MDACGTWILVPVEVTSEIRLSVNAQVETMSVGGRVGARVNGAR